MEARLCLALCVSFLQSMQLPRREQSLQNVVARHFGTQSDSGFLTTTTFARLPWGALEFVGVELASSHSQPGTLMPLRAATARRPASKGGDRVHRPFKFAFCVATGKAVRAKRRDLAYLCLASFAICDRVASDLSL